MESRRKEEKKQEKIKEKKKKGDFISYPWHVEEEKIEIEVFLRR